MEKKKYQRLLRERECVIALNEGIRCAAYILESSYPLSSEGIRFMVKELEKQIAESEIRYTQKLLLAMK